MIMTTLTVTFDTQSFDPNTYAGIASGGVLLRAAGLLNLKWEEFSALEAAQELGLHSVDWEAVRDNSPGSLTCIFRFDTFDAPSLQARLQAAPVLDYELSTP